LVPARAGTPGADGDNPRAAHPRAVNGSTSIRARPHRRRNPEGNQKKRRPLRGRPDDLTSWNARLAEALSGEVDEHHRSPAVLLPGEAEDVIPSPSAGHGCRISRETTQDELVEIGSPADGYVLWAVVAVAS
jgi:hypothetical protein